MPPRTPDDIRAAVLADITSDEDLSTRTIASRHGVSEATVRKIAKDEGIKDAFTRAHTESATRARVADMAARRTELAADLLDDVARLRERAWSEYTYYERGHEGPEEVTLDLPPLGEVRNAYAAIGISVDKHLALDKHDNAGEGLAAVDAWLRGVIGQ